MFYNQTFFQGNTSVMSQSLTRVTFYQKNQKNRVTPFICLPTAPSMNNNNINHMHPENDVNARKELKLEYRCRKIE